MLLSEITEAQYKELKGNEPFWDDKIRGIIQHAHLPMAPFKKFELGDVVYSYDSKYVIKLYHHAYWQTFAQEVGVLRCLHEQVNTVEVPRIITYGQYEGWDYLIMTELKGKLLADLWGHLSYGEQQMLARKLGGVIKQLHQIPVGDGLMAIDVNWRQFMGQQYQQMMQYHKKMGLIKHLYQQLQTYVEENYINYSPRKVLLTGEYTPFNLLMNKLKGQWQLTGLIDFGDCFLGDGDYDLLGPMLFMFTGDSKLNRLFIDSYGYGLADIKHLQKKLMIYTILHRFSNINHYISKNKRATQATTFEDLAEAFFSFFAQ